MPNKWIVTAMIAIVIAWIGVFAVAKWSESRNAPGPRAAELVADRLNQPDPKAPLPVFWDVPKFSFTDQDNNAVSDTSLRGHVWISDFFFSSCTTICPMMTARMSQLEKAIPNADVRFLSFSVDPDHDTPAVLAAYAKMWKADSRWHFLSTDKANLAAVAKGMKTFVKPPDKDNPIQHSSIFLLADGSGKVRGVYDSNDVAAIERLTTDALTLAGTPPAKDATLTQASWPMPEMAGDRNSPGAELYASRGCLACHAQGRVAPDLINCFGRKVKLDNGQTVVADDAYIRESILDPYAKVVAGYPRLMPSYRTDLSGVELQEIVEYVESLKSAAPTNEAEKPAKEEIIDPVCKMAITPTDKTLQTVWHGHTYYFCSDTCHDQFMKNPAKFASASTAAPTTQP